MWVIVDVPCLALPAYPSLEQQGIALNQILGGWFHPNCLDCGWVRCWCSLCPHWYGWLIACSWFAKRLIGFWMLDSNFLEVRVCGLSQTHLSIVLGDSKIFSSHSNIFLSYYIPSRGGFCSVSAEFVSDTIYVWRYESHMTTHLSRMSFSCAWWVTWLKTMSNLCLQQILHLHIKTLPLGGK